MGHQQGQRVGAFARLMDEMDGQAIVIIAIVREAVEALALLRE